MKHEELRSHDETQQLAFTRALNRTFATRNMLRQRTKNDDGCRANNKNQQLGLDEHEAIRKI